MTESIGWHALEILAKDGVCLKITFWKMSQIKNERNVFNLLVKSLTVNLEQDIVASECIA